MRGEASASTEGEPFDPTQGGSFEVFVTPQESSEKKETTILAEGSLCSQSEGTTAPPRGAPAPPVGAFGPCDETEPGHCKGM